MIKVLAFGLLLLLVLYGCFGFTPWGGLGDGEKKNKPSV